MDLPEDETSGGDLEAEPQVTSSDPNERKMARQMRIKRRLETLRKKAMPEGEEEEVEESSLVKEQLKNSAKLLEKLIIEADEYVTNVRVANDSREVDRREEEGLGREKIIQKLKEEGDKANEQFNEISEKWSGILKYHDPLHINDAILEQKEKCDLLIKQKDELIAMLKNELKEQELKFSRDQVKQNDDITTLAHRIEKQVLMMRKAFANEMRLLEDAVMMDRKLLMDVHNKKWDELYKKRAAEEIHNAVKKVEQREEFEATMKKLSTEFHEKYREVRIEIAKDTEALECDLEKIKALSLLNSEKLDYNYQILRKREDENLIIKSQQKRRINKLQDIINGLRHTIRNYERDSNEQIEKLFQQVHKVHDDIFKIEAKADHFQLTSDQRFHHLWEMKKREADGLLERIFRADKVIFEQLLGIEWSLPEKATLERRDLPSFRSAMQIVSEIAGTKSDIQGTKKVLSSRWNVKVLKKGETLGDKARSDFTESTVSFVDQPLQETVARRKLIRHILKQIADKTGFLLESNLKQVLEPYCEDKSMLVKLDNVFAAVGVKKAEDINRMVDFFLPYTYCHICAGGGEEEVPLNSEESEMFMQSYNPVEGYSKGQLQHSEFYSMVLNDVTELISAVSPPDEVVTTAIADVMDEKRNTIENISYSSKLEAKKEARVSYSASGKQTISFETEKRLEAAMFACKNHHPLVISPVYVMRALREFVCNLNIENEKVPVYKMLLNQKRHSVSRLMAQEDIAMYWEKYTQTFTPYRRKVWDSLYAGLKKYYAILQDRKKIQDEVLELRRENEELNKLLKTYMDGGGRRGSCSVQRVDPLRSPLLNICRKL